MSRDAVAVFDANCQDYDAWYTRHSGIYKSEIKALAAVAFTGLGVEIGVGTGRFASQLHVDFGVDPAFHPLLLARSRAVKVIQAQGEELPFREKSFDFVLIVLSLCFVDDPRSMLQESRRILKPGGKLILAAIDRHSDWGRQLEKKAAQNRYYRYAHLFSPREIIVLLQEAGLTLKSTCQTLFHSPENFEAIENPREGFGEGGFVVFEAVKQA